MAFIQLDDLEEREIIPGFHARFVHSDHMTLASWRIEAGAILKLHSHPHEQVTLVIEGQLELTMEGETRTLGPGAVAVIPANIPHNGLALSDCKVIDAFYPVREEFRR